MSVNMNLGDTRAIIETCRRHGLLRNQTAYVLATAYHETAHTMEPVRETLAQTDAAAIQRLDRAWDRGQLTWVRKPYWRDGYFGRGYVQLTHDYNYQRASNELGVDMVKEPSLALDPGIAAEVMVRGMMGGWFGRSLTQYVTLRASDYVGARRSVNGTDRARAIAEYAVEYEAALLAEGYGVEPPAPVANERRDGTPPRATPVQSSTNVASVLTLATTFAQTSETAKQLVGDWSEAFGVSPEVVLAGVALAAIGWIVKERMRKWAEGDR